MCPPSSMESAMLGRRGLRAQTSTVAGSDEGRELSSEWIEAVEPRRLFPVAIARGSCTESTSAILNLSIACSVFGLSVKPSLVQSRRLCTVKREGLASSAESSLGEYCPTCDRGGRGAGGYQCRRRHAKAAPGQIKVCCAKEARRGRSLASR